MLHALKLAQPAFFWFYFIFILSSFVFHLFALYRPLLGGSASAAFLLSRPLISGKPQMTFKVGTDF